MRQFLVRTAHQDVGLQADGTQFLDGMLGGFGLDFTRRAEVRHQRQVNYACPLGADFKPELADGLQERLRLDIPDGTASLDDHDVHACADHLDTSLDFVGDVRNHLHGAAQVVAAALAADDLRIDTAGREVIEPRHAHAGKAFVVAEVQVGFGAVCRDEYFPVLKRVHGPGIDVDVRIHLQHVDLESARRQDRSERCSENALSQGRYDAASNKNESRHGLHLLSARPHGPGRAATFGEDSRKNRRSRNYSAG